MARKRILYVSGVGGIKEDVLNFEFSSFGYIRNIQKKKDQYAFIEFESEDEAASALDNMDGAVIEGKTLFCSYSNESPDIAYSNTAIWATEEGGSSTSATDTA